MKARLGFGVVVISIGLLAGCGRVEMNYVLSADTLTELKDNPDAQQQLAAAFAGLFGAPDEPKHESVAGVIKTTPEGLKAGAESYRRLCMHCHGLSGDGNGPTAPFVFPKPRDYRRGLFKFTATTSGVKPTRQDLLRTLKNGVPGTSMPSFALFDEPTIQRVLDYVILLSIRGETERGVVGGYLPGDQITVETVQKELDYAASSWEGAEEKVVRPSAARPPSDDPESLRRGKELFLSDKSQCAKCHGRQGLGDGLVSDPKETTDSWGQPAKPADLTLGVWRGGGRPLDLFRRIHQGVKGTPMPAQGGNLTDQQIWEVVNYVRSLAYLPDEPAVAKSSAAGHESSSRQN